MPIKFISELKNELESAEKERERTSGSAPALLSERLTRKVTLSDKVRAKVQKVPIIQFDKDCVSEKVKRLIAKYIKEKKKGVSISSFDPDEIFKEVMLPGKLYRDILKEHSKDSKYNHELLPLNWRLRSDKAIDNVLEECKKRCGLLDDSIPADKKLDIEEYIAKTWIFHARKTQIPPSGDWMNYLYLAGRGVGKSTAAVQWIIATAERYPGCRIAIVTNTPDEGWKYLVQQTLKVVIPSWIDLKYNKNDKTITFPNGSECMLHSAHNSEKLRGYRCHFAVCDELCKWKDAEEVWGQLGMTCTLNGKKWGIENLSNRFFISTTPIPSELLGEIMQDKSTIIMRETTFDNAEFIPESSLYALIKRNCGTSFGRQELLGEVLDMTGTSIFSMKDIDNSRLKPINRYSLEKVVIGVDPQARKSSDDEANPSETGIIVAGVDSESRYYILEDYSFNALPSEWVKEVQKAFKKWDADFVVVEKNHGRDLVVEAFRAHLEQDIPIIYVEATKGKAVRAGPVALLYEQGRVHHVGFHDRLESQMCGWSGDPREKSPDRVDAMVWAIHELTKNTGYRGFI